MSDILFKQFCDSKSGSKCFALRFTVLCIPIFKGNNVLERQTVSKLNISIDYDMIMKEVLYLKKRRGEGGILTEQIRNTAFDLSSPERSLAA